MTDVERLLLLDQLATQLRAESARAYDVAASDPDIVMAVGIAMLEADGRRWDDAGPDECMRAYRLAECAISTFLQHLLLRSAP